MLMFMATLQLCQVSFMETTQTVFTMQYKIRHFVRFCNKISYRQASVKHNVSFQRKIWFHNKDMMNFLNFALEECLRDVPKQFSNKFSTHTLYKCFLIGNNLYVGKVINKKVKRWMRWTMPGYWEKHTQWVYWIY